MDKNILKKFAIESRQDLMEKIKNKINTFYIDEDFKNEQKGDVYILYNEKHSLSLTNNEYKNRELLIKRIKELSLEQVIEEAAYTWFNRIIAIRYMEINDMLPLTKDNQSLGIRVLSSKDNTPDPEILKFANLINTDLDIGFKKEKYTELKDDNEKFKYVLLLVCKKLGRVIPQVFDGITDYIDILIPDNLLNDTGFITKVINEVAESNYNQVEIIGWLYQYYNQIEKDRVISSRKTYKKNEIAYATQLFTPDWIVKYMVENSLGKYWVEYNGDGALYPSNNLYPSRNLYPSSSIVDNWKYYIKEQIEEKQEKVKPTDITFIDPCCGSGHILVYAFEIFYQIYLKAGFNKNDIAELILKNNLFGLDIDDRAGQLSILSIILKAREYDKNIFNKDIVKNLNIMGIQESNTISESILENISSEEERQLGKYLIDKFKNAKEIGSLLLLEKQDYTQLEKCINNNNTIFGIELGERLKPLIKLAKIIERKYSIVVTNPPYMNNSVMSSNLKNYIQEHYKSAKSDLFSSFIIRNSLYGDENSYLGFMTPYVWMFISSYEELRKYIIEERDISSLIQFEYSALEEATVPICSFILNNKNTDRLGVYFRLTDFTGGMKVQEKKYLEILNDNLSSYKYHKNAKDFLSIPGSPIAYWISESFSDIFEKGTSLGKIAQVKQGLATSNNNRFLREWYEVNINKTLLTSSSVEESKNSDVKWFPYNKGGEFRKWYGNNDYVVNWEDDGYEIKNVKDENGKLRSRPQNTDYYFNKSITWSLISSSNIAFRSKPFGHIFDVAGMSCFPKDEDYYYLLGFNNTKIVRHIMKFIAPTVNFQVGDIAKIPIIFNDKYKEKINSLVEENISESKEDWDSFEASWDFITHPLIEYKTGSGYDKDIDKWNFRIKDAFETWKSNCDEKFKVLKKNEEELNRIFIDIYGLQDELTPDVEDKDITIRKADKEREIKSLISYAVGCMFGRYSLDQCGLVYAGGDFDKHKYKIFSVDEDNIIPITDEAYFADDIVARFKNFIDIVYGKGTLNENMDFIAETLGKKGTETSEETIRRYFLNDFFNDHVKIYQKRPIYWLFDSGKKNGFKALIYMHRYNENTIPKVRLDYLHRIQTTYDKLLTDINYKLTTDLSMTDKKQAQNRQADLNAKLNEIKEYDEKIAHIANQRINIDLDDGVKVNYDKFKDILAKIK